MTTKKKTVTISRSRWAIPGNIKKFNKEKAKKAQVGPAWAPPATVQLYDSTSKMMCCLGFVCRAEGLKVSQIEDLGLPSDVSEYEPPAWLATIEERAAAINDDEKLGNAKREAKLKKLFADKTPIRLKFVP